MVFVDSSPTRNLFLPGHAIGVPPGGRSAGAIGTPPARVRRPTAGFARRRSWFTIERFGSHPYLLERTDTWASWTRRGTSWAGPC
jgi:hypothetical protein